MMGKYGVSGTSWLRLCTAALALGVSIQSYAASAEAIDLDPELAAKVAREKARIKRDQHQAGKDEPMGRMETVGECGSVNVGNVNSDPNRIGGVPRTNTVVITGPVINVGNKCK
jgi:hypothetical protein